MNTSKQSVSDFLKEEETKETALLATIEAVHGDEHLVTITPFSGEGCGCHSSLTIPKESIEWVEKTGQIHNCCGSMHAVVQLGFKEGASILLSEVFSQLSSAVHMEEASDTPPEITTMEGNLHTMENSFLRDNAFRSDVPATIPFCKPAYEAAIGWCFTTKNGKPYRGRRTLIVYTNPLGKICKREWTACK